MENLVRRIEESIRGSPDLTFNYTINEERKCIIIHADHLSERLSTILGSKSSDELVIDIDQAKKLPHDLVHLTISSEPERRIPGTNLTPDIQLSDGSIIEIATRSTLTDTALRSAVSQKLMKYKDYSDMLCVIAVNFNFCVSNCDLSDFAKSTLIRSYHQGVKMMNDLLVPLGINREDPSLFAGMKFPKTQDFQCDTILNSPNPELKLESWSSYLSNFKGRLKSTVVKLPMVILDDDDTSQLTASSSIDWVNELILSIQKLKPQHTENWDTPKPFLKKRGRRYVKTWPDQVHLNLDNSQRLEIALRGVRAKKFKQNDLIIQNALRRKLQVDHRSDTTHIDSFVNREMMTINTSSQQYDPRFKPLIDEFQVSLENLELMIREVSLNATRKTKKDEFIVRKLLRKPCYVISCNTSYSTQHDKPSHYAILCKGFPLDERMFGAFERLDHGWLFFNFVSTDRRRSEHLMGLPEQSLAIRSLIEEQLGDLGPDLAWTRSLNPTHRILMLILLSDNSNLSITLQNLRYYYMELYCGSPPDYSLKIVSKLPSTCRSLMQLWVVKKLNLFHPIMKVREVSILTDEKEDDDLLGKAEDDLQNIMTPFGFSINSLDKMLLASYLCMLKNKDEQNQGHDTKAIMKKTLKREYEFQSRSNKEVLVEHKTSSSYEVFTANPMAIKRGANLVKKAILKHTCAHSWSDACKKLIWDRAHNQTISNLFSTKSSSIVSVDEAPRELSEYDRRSKVFIRLIEEQGTFKEDLLINSVPDWINKVDPGVSLFKKNQIGGVREIYILNFWFRVAIKYLEDLSRSMCSGHPQEALTKPRLKEEFVPNHFESTKRSIKSDKFTVTLRVSSDMTNWANLMMNDFFECALEEFLPDVLLNNVKRILGIHKKKKLYLPRALIESFRKTSNPESYMDDNLNLLRKEFMGLADPVICSENRPWVSCETNMMQGILHYTSSLYHLCHLEFLKEKVERSANSLGLDCVVSYIVSSDDEGILITLGHQSEEELNRLSKPFLSRFKSLKNSVDQLFGVRTSWEKSSITIREIFEFNSVFRIRNTVGSPLIKFVCRSVDDNISETLNSRVRSMSQQLRSIRENGGSGQLCSLISTLQNRHLRRNLGESVMGWFDSAFYDTLPSFSFFGKLIDVGPTLSGLTSIEYQNWLVCLNDPSALKKYCRHGFNTYVDSDSKEHSLSFRMFPRKKYIQALKQLGLTPRIDLTENDVRIVMSKDRDLDDLRRLNEIRSCSPGIAASFCHLARTDNMRASAYLLTAPLFDGKTYREMVLEETDLEGKLTDFFPSHFEFLLMKNVSEEPKFFFKSNNRRCKRFKYYFPVIDQNEHRRRITSVLSRLWFNDSRTGLSDRHVERLIRLCRLELPWIKDTLIDTLKSSPFPNYYSLLSFFDQFSKSSKPWKLLSASTGGRQSLSEVHLLNTYSGYETVMAQSKAHKREYEWMQVENRIAAWSSLLSSEDHAPDCVADDMDVVFKRIDDHLVNEALSTGRRDSRKIARFIKVMKIEQPCLQDYTSLMEEGEEIWLLPQWVDPETGEHKGRGVLLVKYQSEVVELTLNSSKVTGVKSKLHSHEIFKLIRERSLDYSPFGLSVTPIEPFYPQLVVFGYSRGFRLLIEPLFPGVKSGSTSRVFGCRHSITGNIEFVSGDYIDPIINSYLNNLHVECKIIQCLELSTSPLKHSFFSLIKEVRAGTNLIRLSERVVPFVEPPDLDEVTEEEKQDNADPWDVVDSALLELEEDEDVFDITDLALNTEVGLIAFDRQQDHIQLIMGQILYQVAAFVNISVQGGGPLPNCVRSMCSERELESLNQMPEIKTRKNFSSKISNLMKRMRL